MPQPYPHPYVKYYHDAVKLFEKAQYEECIELAKHNLTEPTLPPYWKIETYLLIFSAENDWYRGEHYRLLAEKVYNTATGLENRSSAERAAFLHLRDLLDEAAQNQADDAPGENPEHVPVYDPIHSWEESNTSSEDEDATKLEVVTTHNGGGFGGKMQSSKRKHPDFEGDSAAVTTGSQKTGDSIYVATYSRAELILELAKSEGELAAQEHWNARLRHKLAILEDKLALYEEKFRQFGRS